MTDRWWEEDDPERRDSSGLAELRREEAATRKKVVAARLAKSIPAQVDELADMLVDLEEKAPGAAKYFEEVLGKCNTAAERALADANKTVKFLEAAAEKAAADANKRVEQLQQELARLEHLTQEMNVELAEEQSRRQNLKTTGWVVASIVALIFPFLAARLGALALWGWMIAKARRDAGGLGLAAGIVGGGFITLGMFLIIHEVEAKGLETVLLEALRRR